MSNNNENINNPAQPNNNNNESSSSSSIPPDAELRKLRNELEEARKLIIHQSEIVNKLTTSPRPPINYNYGPPPVRGTSAYSLGANPPTWRQFKGLADDVEIIREENASIRSAVMELMKAPLEENEQFRISCHRVITALDGFRPLIGNMVKSMETTWKIIELSVRHVSELNTLLRDTVIRTDEHAVAVLRALGKNPREGLLEMPSLPPAITESTTTNNQQQNNDNNQQQNKNNNNQQSNDKEQQQQPK